MSCGRTAEVAMTVARHLRFLFRVLDRLERQDHLLHADLSRPVCCKLCEELVELDIANRRRQHHAQLLVIDASALIRISRIERLNSKRKVTERESVCVCVCVCVWCYWMSDVKC